MALAALPAVVLGTVLTSVAIPVAVKVLGGLGFGFATYVGMKNLFDIAYQTIVTNFDTMPTEALQLLGMANFDKAISMIFSAYAVRLLIMGVDSSGVLTRFGAKGLAESA